MAAAFRKLAIRSVSALALMLVMGCSSPGLKSGKKAFESEEVREALSVLQNEGYILVHHDEVMEKSTYFMEHKPTRVVTVTGDGGTKARSAKAFIYDDHGKAHELDLKIEATPSGERKVVPISSAPRFSHLRFQFEKSDGATLKVLQDGYPSGSIVGLSNAHQPNQRLAVYSNGQTRVIRFVKN